MKVIYELDLGMIINGILIKWGTNRETVRQTLALPFKESDFVFDPSEYGIDLPSVTRRRDIYGDVNTQDYYFFLNYDQNSQLIEFEAHKLTEFIFKDLRLPFGRSIQQVMDALDKFSKKVNSESSYHDYVELKMSIASAEVIRGEEGDDGLSYIYATANAAHFKQ